MFIVLIYEFDYYPSCVFNNKLFSNTMKIYVQSDFLELIFSPFAITHTRKRKGKEKEK